MKKVIIVILLTVVSVGAIVFKLFSNKEVAEGRIYRRDPAERVLVEVQAAAEQAVSPTQSYVGTFRPNREVTLVSEGQGKVVALYVEEGDFVTAEKPLMQIDKQLLEAQLTGAAAAYEDALRDVERYTQVVSGDAMPKMQLDKARLALAAAESQLKVLKTQIAKTTLVAPFSGFLTAKMIDIGAMAAPSVPVGVLTDMAQVKLVVQVPEEQIGQFVKGQSVEVMVGSRQGPVVQGKVLMTDMKGDASHHFGVSILVPNPSGQIRAGMFGYVRPLSPASAAKKTLTVSRKALVGTRQDPKVFIVENGQAVLRSIRTGSEDESQLEVTEGLASGDMVVVSGLINLAHGTPVQIQHQ